MKARSSKCLATFILAMCMGVLLLLPACAQSEDSQSAESAISAESQPSDEASSGDSQESSMSASKTKATANSILDVAKELANGAKQKAGEVAESAVKAKEQMEREAAEREKQREEEAKAKAVEALERADLSPKTEVLEYSNKKAKALKLVECSNSKIDVSAKGKVDLSEVGSKNVTYTLSYEGQTVQRPVKFKIRDTKPPRIDFVSRTPKIDVGTDYDPVNNVNFVRDPVDGDYAIVSEAPASKGKKAGAEVFYDKGWYTVKGSVDTSVAGVYSIDVDASDIHGNTAHRSFDVTVVAPEPEEPAVQQAAAAQAYVLNMNTHKFHYPGCRAVGQMNASNRWDVEMSRDEVVGMGYSSCGICCP